MTVDDLKVWDNPDYIDRYIVVFPDGSFIGMDNSPFYPLGFCQYGDGAEYEPEIEERDGEFYSHLGKKIEFEDLNKDCRRAVLRDLWEINKYERQVTGSR
ncbi:MAG: hypothetical protein ACTSRU_20640 [Candidatus Hodarchaeales archaeon]